MVEGSQSIKLLQGKDERLRGRRVHEVKVDEVINAQTLQHEDDIAQVSTLDLEGERGEEQLGDGPSRKGEREEESKGEGKEELKEGGNNSNYNSWMVCTNRNISLVCDSKCSPPLGWCSLPFHYERPMQ